MTTGVHFSIERHKNKIGVKVHFKATKLTDLNYFKHEDLFVSADNLEVWIVGLIKQTP